MALPGNFEIAPGFRVADWQGLELNDSEHNTPDWQRALAILDVRIRSRFIKPAQFLIDSEKNKNRGTNGFAVLAIDFLLIETIQGFKAGHVSHFGKSKNLFMAFLLEWPAFTTCVPNGQNHKSLAAKVYEQGRCALHHTGSTERLIVKRSGDLFVFHDDERIEINRSILHAELTSEFDSYLSDLRSPTNKQLRKNFKIKMDHICT